MEERTTIDGKRYILISKEDESELKAKDPNIEIYTVTDSETEETERAVPPDDCEHVFKDVIVGVPYNKKQCTKCILEIPTGKVATVK